MAKYTKLPVTIEAIQITRRMTIATNEGVMKGNIGDWLITGVADEQYFCKDDIFKKTYKPASEQIDLQSLCNCVESENTIGRSESWRRLKKELGVL